MLTCSRLDASNKSLSEPLALGTDNLIADSIAEALAFNLNPVPTTQSIIRQVESSQSMNHPKPTPADLLAAVTRTVKDVITHDLSVLFCGINPGLYSAFTGHHFARPGNRFWPALHAGGFTNRQLHPSEKSELLKGSYGLTNLVKRATARSDELTADELVAGGKTLKAKIKRYRPRYIAVLGVVAYRDAFKRPLARLGLQEEAIGETKVWVLPNPSGLNAHYQARDLAKLFRELREAASTE